MSNSFTLERNGKTYTVENTTSVIWRIFADGRAGGQFLSDAEDQSQAGVEAEARACLERLAEDDLI